MHGWVKHVDPGAVLKLAVFLADNTTLPGLQIELAEQVLALGKPTVLVLIHGGESWDTYLLPTTPHSS